MKYLILLFLLISCSSSVEVQESINGKYQWNTFDTMKNPIVKLLTITEGNDSIYTNIVNYDTITAKFRIIRKENGLCVGINEFRLWNQYEYSDSIFIDIKNHYLTWCLNNKSFNVIDWYYGPITRL